MPRDLWKEFEKKYLTTYERRLIAVIVGLLFVAVSIYIGAQQSIARRERKFRRAHPRPALLAMWTRCAEASSVSLEEATGERHGALMSAGTGPDAGRSPSRR